MNASAKIIPFPKASDEPPKPKALPSPDALWSHHQRHEAGMVAWTMAKADINGSGLEPNTRTMLLTLAHVACEQGNLLVFEPTPLDQLNAIRNTKLTRGEIGAAIREIRGATFDGLGLDWRPFQHFALWLWNLIEKGEDPWRPQRRQRKR